MGNLLQVKEKFAHPNTRVKVMSNILKVVTISQHWLDWRCIELYSS